MKRTILFVVLVGALMATASAVAVNRKHGFHDRHAPAKAERILSKAANLKDVHCQWLYKGHRISCTAFEFGGTVHLYVWSGGKHAFYIVCGGGGCSKRYKIKHRFGRLY